LQGAIHRLHAGLEGAGGFVGGEAEHVAQEQDGALVRRQMLERSNEGELDALVGRVARLWRRLEARVLREVARLRVRLEPRDLRPQRAYVVPRIGRKKLVERHDALRALRGKAQGSVRRDRVQPRAQRAPSLETSQPLPRSEQRLLQRIVRIRHRAEQAVAVRVERAAVLRDELIEGAALPAACRHQGLGFREWSARHLGPCAVATRAQRRTCSRAMVSVRRWPVRRISTTTWEPTGPDISERASTMSRTGLPSTLTSSSPVATPLRSA